MLRDIQNHCVPSVNNSIRRDSFRKNVQKTIDEMLGRNSACFYCVEQLGLIRLRIESLKISNSHCFKCVNSCFIINIYNDASKVKNYRLVFIHRIKIKKGKPMTSLIQLRNKNLFFQLKIHFELDSRLCSWLSCLFIYRLQVRHSNRAKIYNEITFYCCYTVFSFDFHWDHR